MMDCRRHIVRASLAMGLLISFGGAEVRGQAEQIVARGVQFLKSAAGGSAGESALAVMAMVKADVPADDPAMVRAVGAVLGRFGSSSAAGSDNYEASVVIMALANLDPVAYRAQIASAAQDILGRQKPNGSWDYQHRLAGDTSISQYAVLGLWEAENAGVVIPPGVWDRAAQWFMSSQSAGGGWTYHRDEGGQDTVSMTAAGVGSLLICERQLTPYRSAGRVLNPLLTPIDQEGERKRYNPSVSTRTVKDRIQVGINWLGANFITPNTALIGHSPYYALYGIERLTALADLAALGGRNWYNIGLNYLRETQGPNGSFSSQYGAVPNTAWALLFSTKSTAKTIRKIQLRRLGAGTLLGGRGLPKDLSQISIAGGRVIARPMDGAIEGMLAVLEDPRVEDAASALAGLVNRYRTEGPRALRPYQDRFRKLLTDPDPGVRRVAAWALGRTGDLAMTLPLIEALRDPEDGVVAEASQSLQLISRKIDGYGPPPSATPERKEAAMALWRNWYESVRPSASEDEDGPARPSTKGVPTTQRTP